MNPNRYTSRDDNVVHHPLGAGSYLWQEREAIGNSLFHLFSLDSLIETKGNNRTLVIHIGAQPNNSPHCGTIVTFSTAFHLAQLLKEHHKAKYGGSDANKLAIHISLDLVDTAPDDTKKEKIDDIVYQRSHRSTGAHDAFLGDYTELMDSMSCAVDDTITLGETKQVDLLSHPFVPVVLEAIIADRAFIGPCVSPKEQRLFLRAPCPHEDCGRADKHAKLTTYTQVPLHTPDTAPASLEPSLRYDTTITFICHLHGEYSLSLSEPEDVQRLEMNTPLRNLVRAYAYSLESKYNGNSKTHMRVTGADYAGMYQELTCFHPTSHLGAEGHLPPVPLPIFYYAPLVTDWSGSKLSKSLYVKEGAYEYLEEAENDWILSYSKMKDQGLNPMTIFNEVGRWMGNPKAMFCRSYTVEYWIRVLKGEHPPVHDTAPPSSHALAKDSGTKSTLGPAESDAAPVHGNAPSLAPVSDTAAPDSYLSSKPGSLPDDAILIGDDTLESSVEDDMAERRPMALAAAAVVNQPAYTPPLSTPDLAALKSAPSSHTQAERSDKNTIPELVEPVAPIVLGSEPSPIFYPDPALGASPLEAESILNDTTAIGGHSLTSVESDTAGRFAAALAVVDQPPDVRPRSNSELATMESDDTAYFPVAPNEYEVMSDLPEDALVEDSLAPVFAGSVGLDTDGDGPSKNNHKTDTFELEHQSAKENVPL